MKKIPNFQRNYDSGLLISDLAENQKGKLSTNTYLFDKLKPKHHLFKPETTSFDNHFKLLKLTTFTATTMQWRFMSMVDVIHK